LHVTDISPRYVTPCIDAQAKGDQDSQRKMNRFGNPGYYRFPLRSTST
jgi:hypothetical protein